MTTIYPLYPPRRFFAPEHGGDTVKGGSPKNDSEGDGAEEILEATRQTVPGRQRKPGTAGPGVPGSRTNPVQPDRAPEPESDKPLTPPSQGTAAGS